ncbi:MAG: hypothetical protein A3F78_13620 [Burkholderiales bacterium RIFCSPLOWO2_12_FULL_61_40]|nr:MAG: hypothetical protein A3F78_13620 [Burkholderiales bacterium RIFCSPLOWO2_12_FULL_61_40]
MSMNRLCDYLDHMLEASLQACAYVEGLSIKDFMEDKRTQQAVVLNLILIGEEATKLLKEHETFANQHPQVPWRSMKGMRNRIAHGYFEINLETVWETIQTALPSLIEKLPAIRASAEEHNPRQ